MILRHSRFSPFSRKVRACLLELPKRLDVELVETNPREDKTLRLLNPMSKVPTLVLDDGEAIFDSVVICEYLAAIAGDTTIVPQRTPAAWMVLRDQAMGDGLCEAAIAMYREKLRPDAQQSRQDSARQREALEATLDLLDKTIESRLARVDVGTVAIACGIGHIELRLKEINWRQSRPGLSGWHDTFDARASMASTRPY